MIVSGCLAERQKESLLETRPTSTTWSASSAARKSPRSPTGCWAGSTSSARVFHPAPTHPLPDTARLRITPRHFAFLKISEGCDRLCTFCAIPKMRGKHATKPIEEVIAEARELAADGVRELVIVAQDTTYYGMDLYGEPRLVELLRELDKVEGLDWIRLMYFYPMYFTDELIDAIADSRSGSSRISTCRCSTSTTTMLRRMQRRVNRGDTEALLAKLRERIPNLVMRTTFITGFPGETDEQFDELVEFVAAQKFERLGVFTYSFEPDTPAAKLPDHLPEEVKNERRERLMAVQQEIAFDWNDAQIGRAARRADRRGRRRREERLDRPLVRRRPRRRRRRLRDRRGLARRAIVPCEIVATSEYDLVAAAVGAVARSASNCARRLDTMNRLLTDLHELRLNRRHDSTYHAGTPWIEADSPMTRRRC